MERTPVDPKLVTTVMEDEARNDNAEKSFTAQTEQAARDAAAKRRQKILQKANERMSIVEGTFSNKVTAGVAVESSSADGAEAALTTEPEDADVVDAPAAVTTSSRLAAMRRRRFKKSSVVTSTTMEPVASETTTDETSPVETVPIPATETLDAVSIDVETEKSSTAEEISIGKEDMAVPAPSLTEKLSVKLPEQSVPLELAEENPPKKKYLGVAKMRRRMIKERHQEADTDVSTDPLSLEGIETPISTVLPKRKRSIVTTLPIAMYLVTTLLLFFAGLNIGLQQSTVNYCYSAEGNTAANHNGVCTWSTVVHSELAPRTRGGLQRILALTGMDPAAEEKKLIKPSIAKPKWQEVLRNEVDDEFADHGSSSQSSLDPLFGVDLDMLTEGEGLYFVLARFAVRVHRWNLAIFYYGPQSFFVSLSSFVWSLIQFPPILFLLAITIRQVIGKVVLGAKLPEKIVDETQHKDIMSSIKSFISNLLSSSFPTAVTFYDIYTHLRSDMYVVLCGLFVGWAWSHNHQAGSPFEVPPLVGKSRDEL
jgi:hypothetical protein